MKFCNLRTYDTRQLIKVTIVRTASPPKYLGVDAWNITDHITSKI